MVARTAFFSIIIIGDELLTGSKVDSNSTFISAKLAEIGVDVKTIMTVGDDEKEIIDALGFCVTRSDGVIVSGGLGPTSDDKTKDAICKFVEVNMVEHKEILDDIKQRFSKRGVDMPEPNKEQAYQPEGAILFRNPVGTAYGFEVYKDEKPIIALPGVPAEMKAIMVESVIPSLKEKGFGLSDLHILDAKVVGLAESAVYDAVGPLREWAEKRESICLAYYPHFVDVTVRVKVRGEEEFAEKMFKEAKSILEDILGEKLYGYGEDGLEVVVGKLLRQNGMTISTAESCTGGLVSNRIVSVPGASDYFLGGVVAYSNEAKSNLLGVSEKTLSTFGAVSPETAEEMALGVRKKFASNIAVSTTGIAGPTGGTAEKPVGLVYVGWSYDNELGSKKLMLGEMTRDRVRLYTSQMALDVARRILSGMSLE